MFVFWDRDGLQNIESEPEKWVYKALWNALFGAPRFSYLISVWFFCILIFSDFIQIFYF
jgi:hypothetical protein